MRKLFVATLPLVVGITVVLAQMGLFGGQGQAAGGPRVISVLGVGQVQGEDAFVHITVLVPPGQDDRVVADAALAAQGARRATAEDLQAAPFATNGLVWDQFGDADPGNDFVAQSYNPAKDPSGIDGAALLQSTHATWTDVATSSFSFAYGGTTTRCPSLVDECPGPQAFDGFNDVTFLTLAGPCNAIFGCTIGVTWYSTSIDEADMALNTKAKWNDGCVDVSGRIDAETVILHEGGHVVGLGHSNDSNAIMHPSYQGAQCTLAQDDIDGITFLYGADGGTPEPTATPTDTPIPTATPTEGPTATPTPTEEFCPKGWQRRGLC